MKNSLVNIFLFTLLSVIILLPNIALADDPAPAPKQSVTTFSDICKSQIKPDKMLGNIMRCAERVLESAGNRVLFTYIRSFSSVVYYCVMLAIMFFGIRMALGVSSKGHNITVAFLIKIILVLYFCSPQGQLTIINYRDTLIKFPKAISIAILSGESSPTNVPILDNIIGVGTSVGVGLFGSVFPEWQSDLFYDRIDTEMLEALGVQYEMDDKGNNDPDSDDYNPYDDEPKELADCVNRDDTTGTYSTGPCTKNTNPQRMVGIFALAAGLFATGPMGVMVTTVILTYMLGIVLAMAQIILYFLVVTVAIYFLAAITPIALVCLLFEPTKRITEIWFKYLIAYSLQPIILCAFLLFAMIILKSINAETRVYYKKILYKWENKENNPEMDMTLFNCGEGGNSADVLNSQSASSSSVGMLFDIAKGMRNFNRRNNSGNLRPEDMNTSDTPGCSFKMPVLRLDEELAVTGLPNSTVSKLTKQDIADLMGLKIASLLLFMFIVSFTLEFPSIISSMMGTSGGGTDRITSAPGSALINAGGSSIVSKIGTAGGGLLKTGAKRF